MRSLCRICICQIERNIFYMKKYTIIALLLLSLCRPTIPLHAEVGLQIETALVAETMPMGENIAEEVISATEEYIRYYDIPLSQELQAYVFERCKAEGIDHRLVFAMMEVESGFNADIVSKTGDYGLMQINEINHKWLAEIYGMKDMLNAKENIYCGVKMIAELLHKHGDTHKALMAYNMGDGGARKLWKKEIASSKYSRKVVENMDKYKE